MNDKQKVELPEPETYQQVMMGLSPHISVGRVPLYTATQLKAHAEQYARAMVEELDSAWGELTNARNRVQSLAIDPSSFTDEQATQASRDFVAALDRRDAVLAKLGDGK